MLAWLTSNADTIWTVASSVIATASLLANLTPTETDNNIVNFVGKIVNFLAAYWHNPDKPAGK